MSGAENQHQEFEREKYPTKEGVDKNDDIEEEFQGITLKGKSRKYIQAYNKMRKMLTNKKSFNVKGYSMKIIEVKPNKPMKVEVGTSTDQGKAQIQCTILEKRVLPFL